MTAVLVLLCVLSRVVAIPQYLQDLGLIRFSDTVVSRMSHLSAVILFASGGVATGLILYFVFHA